MYILRMRVRVPPSHGCFNAAKKACKRAQFACAYRARVTKSTQQLKPVQTGSFSTSFFYKTIQYFSKTKNELKKQTLFYTFPCIAQKKARSWSSAQAAAETSPKRSHKTVSVYSPATASRKFCQLLPRHYALLGSPLPLFPTTTSC